MFFPGANMLYAVTNDGQRIRPCKDTRGLCPHCRMPLIPRCGRIKIHHWAHKEAKGCLYSFGMTPWHYQWLAEFDNHPQDGWEVEYFFNSIRFDAFNPKRMQAVEFQRSVDLDYIETKISICRNEGIKLFWLISPHLFKNFVYTRDFMGVKGHVIFALRRGKRRIDVLLDNFLRDDNTAFLVDFRKQASLPIYVTDSIDIRGCYLCQDTSMGRGKVHQMPTGIYVIQEAPQTDLYRSRWWLTTTLFLDYRKSHFS